MLKFWSCLFDFKIFSGTLQVFTLCLKCSQVSSSLGFSRSLTSSTFSGAAIATGPSSSLQFCDKLSNTCELYNAIFDSKWVFFLMPKCIEDARQEVRNPSRPQLRKCHLQFKVSKKFFTSV